MAFVDMMPIKGNMATGRSAVTARGSSSKTQYIAITKATYAHFDSLSPITSGSGSNNKGTSTTKYVFQYTNISLRYDKMLCFDMLLN